MRSPKLNVLQSIVMLDHDYDIDMFKRLCDDAKSEEADWLKRRSADIKRSIRQSSDTSAWALYYRGLFRRQYMEQSANLGFLPALSFLERDLDRCIEMGDGYACFVTGKYKLGALRGSLQCIMQLNIKTFDFQLACFVQFQGCLDCSYYTLQAFVEAACVSGNFKRLYSTGLACHGVVHIVSRYQFMQYCLYVYNTATNRARRAALEACAVLRRLLGRDVAQMIAREIYATRATDPESWIDTDTGQRKFKLFKAKNG
jgi:hypothetical protein